ncbi:MAG: hypothetical protein QN163_06330 [Armatimonadota bacterium]|nr:hypothetical protein [Armatimonadota bacterium]MDR5697812.1 hypothetical protein [Armatimonadota bacterium]
MGYSAERKRIAAVGTLLTVLALAAGRSTQASDPPVRAIRFDPGYYYNTGLSADVLAARLVNHWADHGVNLVYFYAYSFAYGARYPTRYLYNAQEDFGRLNLLQRIVSEAHRRGIRVIAWVYVLRHKGAWEARPSWRSLTADGTPYREGFDQYFLSPHHPEAVTWWLGFLEDLLRAVPDLDGVDLAEPVVNWWGDTADHSLAATYAFHRVHPRVRVGGQEWLLFRADALRVVLERSTELARRYGKEVHVTTVMTPEPNGTLISSDAQRDATGFDLDGLLSGRFRPDVVNVELIFQQWASLYRNPGVFTPEWTARAARAADRKVRGRARLVIHVELSSFGTASPTVPDLSRVLTSLQRAGYSSVDVYAGHLIDAIGGWEALRSALLSRIAAHGR